MSGQLPSPAAGAEAAGERAPRRVPRRRQPAPAPPPPAQIRLPDLRLLIEDAQAPEQEVYTVVDRSTGEVISRFLREEMKKRADNGLYAAGDGVNVTA